MNKADAMSEYAKENVYGNICFLVLPRAQVRYFYVTLFFSAMKDIESERLERERQLQEKRENLQAFQFQLTATNNHKNQVEANVNRLTEHTYQLRY
jgi:hypothetical protein